MTSQIKTIRDQQDEDALIESWMESDKIGQLIRDGRTIYYAIINGLPFEGATRYEVACELYACSIE